jgi:DNA-binding transcriptional regulator YiaG
MYHYKESGLKNIWLVNGYSFRKTPYGRTVSIEDLQGLHQAIGLDICERSDALTGAEFRFLRKEMELTQESLASFLGVSGQQVALYERGKPTLMADRLMRAYFREHASGNAKLKELISFLNARDKKAHQQSRITFRADDGWHPSTRCA